MYEIYSSIPMAVDNPTAWSNESKILDVGNTWAINHLNTNERIVLSNWHGLPVQELGMDLRMVGLTVEIQPGIQDESGIVWAEEPEPAQYRLEVAISKDGGSSWSTTTHVVNCRTGGIVTVGSYDSLWGFSDIAYADFTNFAVSVRRPTHLAGESTNDLARTVEHVTMSAAIIDVNTPLAITEADGACDDSLHVEWEG